MKEELLKIINNIEDEITIAFFYSFIVNYLDIPDCTNNQSD